MTPFTLLIIPGLLVVAASGGGHSAVEDWTRWGGPARTGVTPEAGWALEGEELWSRNVGLGYSSVVVRGDVLYTLGFDKDREHDVVVCLRTADGEPVWSHDYPAELMAKAHKGGTLTTPTLDGEHVFVASRRGELRCLNARSGELVWEKDQKRDYDLELPTWGFAASPYVLGERVILNVGRVVAYDKNTGRMVWKSARNYGDAYSTPIEFELDGRTTLAVFAGNGLALLDAESGKERFTSRWETKYDVNAATPVVLGDRIFISSGYGKGCAMLGVSPKGVEEIWTSKVMRNHMTGCIPYGDHLYGFDDSILKCIDLDGQEIWRKRGLGKGALTIADGKLIVLGDDGELVIAPASPEGFETLSSAKALDGGVCWTPPVLSGGRIYCRNQKGQLACRDHRGEE